MVSGSFAPNLAPLPSLAQLQQKVALIRWTISYGILRFTLLRGEGDQKLEPPKFMQRYTNHNEIWYK